MLLGREFECCGDRLVVREEAGRLVDDAGCGLAGGREAGVGEDEVQPPIRSHVFTLAQRGGKRTNEGLPLGIDQVHEAGVLESFQVPIIELAVAQVFPFRPHVQPLEKRDHVLTAVVDRLVVQ